ncbi:unnamed protein product [Brachionus calyciflorus]|uniref:G-protein coupled receptors family 1 profile domain-containing protein n=1 Tax=Brachionus calyciflorus TaxID=104777 RepID=A0A814CMH3_9BILA|nr:unnamed protein product [Brachionus calyciflorus]
MSDYILNLRNLTKAISFYFSSIGVSIGLFLNLTTILIFQAKCFRKSNIRIFYTTLGLFDIAALLNSILFIQLLPNLGFNLSIGSDSSCKFVSLWRRCAIQIPSWTHIIITYDRFKSICFPKKYNTNNKKVFLKLGFIIIFIFLINLPHIFFYLNVKTDIIQSNISNVTVNSTRITSQACIAVTTIQTLTDIMNVCFRSFIPFVIMFILNVVMTKKFLKSKKKFYNGDSKMKKEFYFTKTVITMNITFFILYFPWSVWYILNLSFSQQIGKSDLFKASMDLLQSISFSIAYLNNCSSFVVNFISNQIFRKVFIGFIGQRKILTNSVNSLTNNAGKKSFQVN